MFNNFLPKVVFQRNFLAAVLPLLPCLCCPASPLQLLEASIIIHGPVLTDIKRKSSLKRLGDIVKIFRSVGLVAEVMKKKEEDSKKVISYQYVGQEVPQLLPVFNTQCKDVEMEDLAAVRVIVD